MPKDLYLTEAVYKTPSGKLSYFSKMLAGTPDECSDEIQRLLRNEQRFGRRRVGQFVGTSTRHAGQQIQTR